MIPPPGHTFLLNAIKPPAEAVGGAGANEVGGATVEGVRKIDTDEMIDAMSTPTSSDSEEDAESAVMTGAEPSLEELQREK